MEVILFVPNKEKQHQMDKKRDTPIGVSLVKYEI
jgi:hypothetical protein